MGHNSMFEEHTMFGESIKDLKMVTYVRRFDHEDTKTNYKVFDKGAPINIQIKDLLYLAGESLDDLAPQSTLAGGDDAAIPTNDPSASFLTIPYNRLIGARLDIDMEITNMYADYTGDAETYSWGRREIACILTVKRTGAWTSSGSVTESHLSGPTKQAPGGKYTGTGANVLAGTELRRYNQGLKIAFMPHGNVAFINPTYMVQIMVQAIVLLGVASQVVQYVAMYCLGDDSKIFTKYQDTHMSPQEVVVRTAALAAKHAEQFLTSMDKGRETKKPGGHHARTGFMSKPILFRTLQVLFGKRSKDACHDTSVELLSKGQIAKLTHDICQQIVPDRDTGLTADQTVQNEATQTKTQDGIKLLVPQITVEEYCQFATDEGCDLVNVVQQYKKYEVTEEDKTILAQIEKELAASEYLQKLDQELLGRLDDVEEGGEVFNNDNASSSDVSIDQKPDSFGEDEDANQKVGAMDVTAAGPNRGCMPVC